MTPADELLERVIRATDRDEAQVRLRVLTADGSLFTGETAPAQALAWDSEDTLVGELAAHLAATRRGAGPHLSEAASMAKQTLGYVSIADDEEVAGGLTLGPVEWVPQHGRFKVDLPVARIDVASIVAWWLVGGQVTEAQSGSQWLIGGIFPLPVGH